MTVTKSYIYVLKKDYNHRQKILVKLPQNSITANTSAIWQYAAHTTDQLHVAA